MVMNKKNRMTPKELFSMLHSQFQKIITENDLAMDSVEIKAKTLTPKEAIGETKRQDYPILLGKEMMLEATFRGAKGQAFTDSPADYNGSVSEIMNLDLNEDPYARGIFIATMNAVMAYLGLADRTIHCKNDEPEQCAEEFVKYLNENYQKKQEGKLKITQIGFQPAILAQISQHFDVRILDLNPDIVGKKKSGVLVEHGMDDYDDAVDWADLVLCTGSTLCNGSLVNFMDIGKEVIFYGTTLAGAAPLLGLKRACFCSK